MEGLSQKKVILISKSIQTIQSEHPKILRHKISGLMLKEIGWKYLDEMDKEIPRNKALLRKLGVEGRRQHTLVLRNKLLFLWGTFPAEFVKLLCCKTKERCHLQNLSCTDLSQRQVGLGLQLVLTPPAPLMSPPPYKASPYPANKEKN